MGRRLALCPFFLWWSVWSLCFFYTGRSFPERSAVLVNIGRGVFPDIVSGMKNQAFLLHQQVYTKNSTYQKQMGYGRKPL
jgi:hypothetical protein